MVSPGVGQVIRRDRPVCVSSISSAGCIAAELCTCVLCFWYSVLNVFRVDVELYKRCRRFGVCVQKTSDCGLTFPKAPPCT